MKKLLTMSLSIALLFGCSDNQMDDEITDGCNDCAERSCFAMRSPAPFVGNIWREEVESDGDFIQYWNQITPENAGKWRFVETERDSMDWSALDQSYQYAVQQGIPYKLHTLFWGAQQPLWLPSLSHDAQLTEIEQWVAQLAERYPASDQIDVVNEPLHAPPDYIDVLGGDGSTGWDWVITAFRMARRSFPDSQLLLNDFNILRLDEATSAYGQIVELLHAEQLIDGIGLQGHFLEDVPFDTIKRNLDQLATIGLPIYISEYDVDLADDEQQADVFIAQVRLFLEHPAVQGLTLWGYRENQLWQPDAHLVRRDGSQRPAMSWLTQCLSDRVRASHTE